MFMCEPSRLAASTFKRHRTTLIQQVAAQTLIEYSTTKRISPEQFVDVLTRSTLSARRPVDKPECVKGMVKHADITVTAWRGELLVGVARSVTDYNYCCYLSDLAVDQAFQRTGIGRELVRLTKEQIGPHCKLLLFSAPGMETYYAHIGFENNSNGWVME